MSLHEPKLHHDGGFYGVAVISFTPAHSRKAVLHIKLDASGVRFANFEKHAIYAAFAKLYDCGSQQGAAFASSPAFRRHGHIQDLRLVLHLAANQKADDFSS